MRYTLFLFFLIIASPAFSKANSSATLNLDGYADETGAISVLYHGETIDPYFTLQALLIAKENGLDITNYALNWANWLMSRQKLDATFDRFCRRGPVWAPCKTADADDALLAFWLKFLDTFPKRVRENPKWISSYHSSEVTLSRLFEPNRGVYLVSPIYQYGLFMDNIEVWSYKQAHIGSASESRHLSKSIFHTFFNPENKNFLVSTQPEQKTMKPAFYPDYVAQIFPLLFDYNHLPEPRNRYYKKWMYSHRSEWLKQSQKDFSWGIIAILALKYKDFYSAECWLQEALPYRHSPHWTVTDEVAYQILIYNKLKPHNYTKHSKCLS